MGGKGGKGRGALGKGGKGGKGSKGVRQKVVVVVHLMPGGGRMAAKARGRDGMTTLVATGTAATAAMGPTAATAGTAERDMMAGVVAGEATMDMILARDGQTGRVGRRHPLGGLITITKIPDMMILKVMVLTTKVRPIYDDHYEDDE